MADFAERYERARRRIDAIFSRRNYGWYGRSGPDDYLYMMRGMERRDIAIIPRVVPPDVLRRAAKDRVTYPSRNESADHMLLKGIGRAIMTSYGGRDAMCEARLLTGRADVFSRRARWQIECGNTRISSFFEAARSGYRWSILPYQPGLRGFSEGKAARVIMFDLYASLDFLRDMQADMLERQGKMLNARRTVS